MSFFFDDVSTGKSRKPTIPLETAKQLGCAVCPLKKGGAQSPDMPPRGADRPLIYFLGEAPGHEEDKVNRPFVGPSGKRLLANLPSHLQSAIRLNNAVRTHPTGNRTPTELELACCRKSIVEDIQQTQPEVVVAVGSTALNWLFHDENAGSQDIGKWRGKFFPIRIGNHTCWGYCIYHPSYILRNRRTDRNGNSYPGDLDYLFDADMRRLFDFMEKPTHCPSRPDAPLQGIVWTEGLKSNKELDKVLNWLERMMQERSVAVDYETTALRPFVPTARLLTVSVGTEARTVAFPLDYPNAWNRDQQQRLNAAWKQFLLSPVPKIAQNAKFELEWSGYFFGEEVIHASRWEDTQGVAYTLDERKGTHNLDFMIREYFGFWLKSLSNLNRARMIDYPLSKILPYNGLDTKWTHALFHAQRKKLIEDRKLTAVYESLLNIMKMLTQVQLRGVLFSPAACDALRVDYEAQLKQIEADIYRGEESRRYKEAFNEPFNPSSPQNVMAMFRDVLGLGEQLSVGAGKLSTDESVLSKMTAPLAKQILDYRGVAKKISTYIDPMPGFVMPDGRIHTTYNPYETTTGRLCVAKGTLVEVVRDFSKYPMGVPIEDVRPGDWAYTYDDTLNVVLRKVLWAGKTGTKKVMRLHWIGDGRKTNGTLDITGNHPVRLVNGEYKRADELVVGDRVLSLKLDVQVDKVEWLDGMVDVYDLEVEETHNFIANQLAVSNSSDSPNLQNWPSKTGKEPRRMLVAPPGMALVCCDYGQIEARLIGAASQDANFCRALWENYDVHLEWAKKIAEEYPKVIGGPDKLGDAKALKKFRNKVKNLWVFPAFYGASYRSIAAGLGIPEDVVQYLFEEFWRQFSGVKKWQRWLLARYNKLGYVESFFGRRRHAPLSANAVLNSAIQSTASDICVLGMVALDRLGMNVVLNVHDEIGIYVPMGELEDQVETMVVEMTRPRLPWLNIPISVEVKVGDNWFEMEDVLTVDSTNFHKVPRAPLDFRSIYDL